MVLDVHQVPHVREQEQTSQHSHQARQEAQHEAGCQVLWHHVCIMDVSDHDDPLPKAILISGDDLLVVGLELVLELFAVILCMLPDPVHDSPGCSGYRLLIKVLVSPPG